MTDYTKIDAYPQLHLRKGEGKSYADGFCVMQAVAWFAGEKHTDRPECACPVLTSFAISINDRLPDEKRQKLRKLIAPLTSTRSPAHETARHTLIVRRVVHEIVAPVFDKRWPEHAKAMRAAQTLDALRAACLNARAAAAAAYAYAAAAAAYADAADADAAAAYAAYAAYAAAAAYADADAYKTALAEARDRNENLLIDILAEAIRLGPNGGDDLTPFAEKIHEMKARGFIHQQEDAPAV